MFEYCTDRGDILKFEEKQLQILPDNQYLEYGSFIKMYEYRLEKPANIHLDLWRDLNRLLFNPAVPILLYESRDYTTHSKDKLLLGNKIRLRIDERSSVDETLSIDRVLGEFGMCRIEVIILTS